MNKINILLLNWNSGADIEISLENISKSNYINYRVILIDNYSKEQDRVSLIKIYTEYKKKS